MTKKRLPSDEEYINEFHKQWNEACMKERERTQSMRFSAEFLRAQSQRLRALVEKGERMEQLEGKRRRKKELTDEDIKKEIKELDNIIAECDEILKIHKPCERRSLAEVGEWG